MAHAVRDRLIARGEHLGLVIATFRVTPEEVAATGKRFVHGTNGRCMTTAAKAVFFGEFPGDERILLFFDLTRHVTEKPLAAKRHRQSIGRPKTGRSYAPWRHSPTLLKNRMRSMFADRDWTANSAGQRRHWQRRAEWLAQPACRRLAALLRAISAFDAIGAGFHTGPA